MNCQLYLQITSLITLGTAELLRGEPDAKAWRPETGQFRPTESLSPVVPGYVGYLGGFVSHPLTAEERGETFADSRFQRHRLRCGSSHAAEPRGEGCRRGDCRPAQS